jgi:hypothetical protein
MAFMTGSGLDSSKLPWRGRCSIQELQEDAGAEFVGSFSTHNARGEIINVYTTWKWPAHSEAVSCLKVDPDLLPGRIHDIPYDICVSENATRRQ